MKKIICIAAVMAAVLGSAVFQSCNKVKDIVKVNIPLTMEYDFVIPPIPDTTQFVTAVIDVDYNVDSVIKKTNEQLGAGNVKSASISAATLSILPANQDAQDNLTAISALSIALSSDKNQDWITLCSIAEPPTDPYRVDIPVNKEADLSSYFTSGRFRFKMGAKAHRFTSKEIRSNIAIKFIITASL